MDRDDFDKFRTRGMIAQILDEIWRLPECVDSAVRLARGARGRELLGPFMAAVLGDLLHNLQVGRPRGAAGSARRGGIADPDSFVVPLCAMLGLLELVSAARNSDGFRIAAIHFPRCDVRSVQTKRSSSEARYVHACACERSACWW